MNVGEERERGLAKSIKLGVGALVVLAGTAVVAGGVWYFQHNALPTCGSPDAKALVTKIVSQNFAKELTADAAATMTKSVELSLDLIEKGELSADGNVRKCSAQLAVTLSPEMMKFASAKHADAFEDVRKESDDKYSVPIAYELKALEGESSNFLASVPGSLPVATLRRAVVLLATAYEPPSPVAQQKPAVETAVSNESRAPVPDNTQTATDAAERPSNWNAMTAEQQLIWTSNCVHPATAMKDMCSQLEGIR